MGFRIRAGFLRRWIQAPYNEHYKMYSYIVKELPAVVDATNKENNPTIRILVQERSMRIGHSMGGHGALMIALKNPGMFASVSAFAPICNPSSVNVRGNPSVSVVISGSVQAQYGVRRDGA